MECIMRILLRKLEYLSLLKRLKGWRKRKRRGWLLNRLKQGRGMEGVEGTQGLMLEVVGFNLRPKLIIMNCERKPRGICD